MGIIKVQHLQNIALWIIITTSKWAFYFISHLYILPVYEYLIIYICSLDCFYVVALQCDSAILWLSYQKTYHIVVVVAVIVIKLNVDKVLWTPRECDSLWVNNAIIKFFLCHSNHRIFIHTAIYIAIQPLTLRQQPTIKAAIPNTNISIHNIIMNNNGRVLQCQSKRLLFIFPWVIIHSFCHHHHHQHHLHCSNHCMWKP